MQAAVHWVCWQSSVHGMIHKIQIVAEDMFCWL